MSSTLMSANNSAAMEILQLFMTGPKFGFVINSEETFLLLPSILIAGSRQIHLQTIEFGIEGGCVVSEFMCSMLEENDFYIEGVSNKLELITFSFCLDNDTEFCLGCNTLQK
ncbi:hypothetical protein CEXT_26401 [Caerostris extrusa]|uniref:Uncharacterized protein n=1 Tax=Caerostris extrusa TaxID=172846 RepID=A0AAV4VD27_CAEEX|nr:hypothetical protein CEXT_26401 [Caerostris extrusa]